MVEQERYGCPECWPESSDAAWEAGRQIKCRHDLINDSHFHVMIMTCGSCGQAFLWVFTELIDWAAGDDSQAWCSWSRGVLRLPHD